MAAGAPAGQAVPMIREGRDGNGRAMPRFLVAALVALVLLASAAPAGAAPSVRFGLQDDAWLTSGPSPATPAARVALLKKLGVQLVRFTLRWDAIARGRPAQPASPDDPAYDWTAADGVLAALRSAGIPVLLTIYGTPSWANGGHAPAYVPTSPSSIAAFTRAAAHRYPWVRTWTIWNEPNATRSLRPASPALYVQRLLNPAYAALHATVPGVQVGGGVTAPRANTGGVSPLAWIAGMGKAHARLDAYAHNPYPGSPAETPLSRACGSCTAVTMSNLTRLIAASNAAFGRKPIWLTEYGYQTNPPDSYFGVSLPKQALYLDEAALRVYQLPQVTLLVNFLFHDEPAVGGWQSGFVTVAGKLKPSFDAFRLAVAQVSRHGTTTVLWGQVRPGSGVRPYVLQEQRGTAWVASGGSARTSAAGFFTRTVHAAAGTRLRVYSPHDRAYSRTLVVT
jgi:hypothetical protein